MVILVFTVFIQSFVYAKQEINLNTTDQYQKDKVYWRVLIAKFNHSIPKQYENILNYAQVGMKRDVNGMVCLYTYQIPSFGKLREKLVEFNEIGVENMKIISYYDSNVISFDDANKIVEGNYESKQLNTLKEIDGISADQFMYYAEAIHYKVWIGSFVDDDVPLLFADFLINLEKQNFIVTSEMDANGIQNYYIDKLESHDLAIKLLDDVKLNVWNLAKVLAFHKYSAISIEKAKQIKGQ